MQGEGLNQECLGRIMVLLSSLGDNGGAVSHGRGTLTVLLHIFPHTVRGVRNNKYDPTGL